MSRRQLTQKQLSFLEYLRGHVDQHKVWPTYREIADHFEYRSPNSVTQNLQALSRKGFLQRSKNGYALIEQAAREGSVRVRGTLRSGRIEPAPSDRLSLTTLFPDVAALQAVELSAGTDRTAEFGDARYVFVDEGDVPEGETVVVVDGNRVSLGRVGPGGALEADHDHEHVEPQVLGRYAGHAGPYGIVRATAPRTEPVEI
ncbi:LexA family protein [Rubrivirga sp.]|uniref:LexA family protein n=1 Tax=Rubrivirga sp. TaxID=1885344 RepID=UPI003C7396EA